MYLNLYKLFFELSSIEDDIKILAQNTDLVEPKSNIRSIIRIKETMFEKSVAEIDKSIQKYNKNFNENVISFRELRHGEYMCLFEQPTFLNTLKLEIENFIYSLDRAVGVTSFQVIIETDVNEIVFNAIPYRYAGDYLEVVKLSAKENQSKFRCKNSYSYKVYDESFNLIENNAIRINSLGYIEIPRLSGDEIYLSYTPVYDSYEYPVNRAVKSILLKTNVSIPADKIKMINF